MLERSSSWTRSQRVAPADRARIHQQDPTESRLFLPPTSIRSSQCRSPSGGTALNALGARYGLCALRGQGKTGIVITRCTTVWTPAGLPHTMARRIRPEAASANLASADHLPVDSLRPRGRGFNPHEPVLEFSAMPGGPSLVSADIVRTSPTAPTPCSKRRPLRDHLLENFLTVEGMQSAVEGVWPYAYVLPRQHQIPMGLATCSAFCIGGQVDNSLRAPSGSGFQRFRTGIYVVCAGGRPVCLVRQTLLEPQLYPTFRGTRGDRPLPSVRTSPATHCRCWMRDRSGTRDSLRIGCLPVRAARRGRAFGLHRPEAATDRVVHRIVRAAIDECWTRWLFGHVEGAYASVVDSWWRAGKLKDHFDVDRPARSVAPRAVRWAAHQVSRHPYLRRPGDRGGGRRYASS